MREKVVYEQRCYPSTDQAGYNSNLIIWSFFLMKQIMMINVVKLTLH